MKQKKVCEKVGMQQINNTENTTQLERAAESATNVRAQSHRPKQHNKKQKTIIIPRLDRFARFYLWHLTERAKL